MPHDLDFVLCLSHSSYVVAHVHIVHTHTYTSAVNAFTWISISVLGVGWSTRVALRLVLTRVVICSTHAHSRLAVHGGGGGRCKEPEHTRWQTELVSLAPLVAYVPLVSLRAPSGYSLCL